MKTGFDPNLLNELIDYAHNPPGGDPVLGKFYTAVVELVEGNKTLAKIITAVQKIRPDITDKHLSYLIFRAYQAIKLKQNDFSYKHFSSVIRWKKELSLICSGKKGEEFKKLLSTKTNSTTIYQRYIGPRAIIAYLWDNQPVSVADLGCGGNYGLRGMELKEPFEKFQDKTPNKIIIKLLSKNINFKKGLAIDKENPDSEEATTWRMACSFYPSELDQMKKVQTFEKRIRLSKKVEFIQADLLKRKPLPKKEVEAVILSTILYQQTLPNQLTLINKAKRLLRPNGIIIVQDFAVKTSSPSRLDFSDSWFGRSFSYGTFIVGPGTNWKFWEIFRWNNGRCRIVKAGEDLKELQALLVHTAHPG